MRPKAEHEISFNSRLGSFLHISLVTDAEVCHEPKRILWMTRGSGTGSERMVGLGLATNFGLCYCAFDFFFQPRFEALEFVKCNWFFHIFIAKSCH